MQEWIIAMLVISVLLLLRDMAKTIFSEMKKSAAALDYDRNPQKEKMQRYAESFQKLANSFYGLPGRKDYLSSSDRGVQGRSVPEMPFKPGMLDTALPSDLSAVLQSAADHGRE